MENVPILLAVPSLEPPPYKQDGLGIRVPCSGLVMSGIDILPCEWGLDDRREPWLSRLCWPKTLLQQYGVGEVIAVVCKSRGNTVS